MNTLAFHSTYGHGIILGTRHSGFELQVKFDSGITRWVRRDQVELPTPTAPATEISKLQPPVFRRSKPRRILESLRMGIVPDDCVDDFTFGRDTEVLELKQWLTD